jgi:hypothetical protein
MKQPYLIHHFYTRSITIGDIDRAIIPEGENRRL